MERNKPKKLSRVTVEAATALRQKLQALRQQAKDDRQQMQLDRTALREMRKHCKELQSKLDRLQDEVEEQSAQALDQLQDRAEVVGELLKRAVPAGWQLQRITQQQGNLHCIVSALAGIAPGASWQWVVYRYPALPLEGTASSYLEAAQAAEAVMKNEKAPKAKKVPKATRERT